MVTRCKWACCFAFLLSACVSNVPPFVQPDAGSGDGVIHNYACTPGIAVCSVDGLAVERCDENGLPHQSRCDPGICKDAKCIDDPCLVCNGDTVPACVRTHTSAQDCKALGRVCANGECVPPGTKSVDCVPKCAANEWCNTSSTPPVCSSSSGGCSIVKPSGKAFKISKIQILPSNEGCDLNGDGSVDNALGSLAPVGGFKPVGPTLASENFTLNAALLDGTLLYALRAISMDSTGVPSALEWLIGIGKGCEGGSCSFSIDDSSYTSTSSGTCPVRSVFPASGSNFGPASHVSLPFYFNSRYELIADGVRFVPELTKWNSLIQGRLCGYILPGSVVHSFVAPDIDADGKGVCVSGSNAGKTCYTGTDCGSAIFSCRHAESISFAIAITASLQDLE